MQQMRVLFGHLLPESQERRYVRQRRMLAQRIGGRPLHQCVGIRQTRQHQGLLSRVPRGHFRQHPHRVRAHAKIFVTGRRGQNICLQRVEPMDLVSLNGKKILGGSLRKKAGKGLYQGSLRPEGLGRTSVALRDAVARGLDVEFGQGISREIEPRWLEAGAELETRYRSADWNERR